MPAGARHGRLLGGICRKLARLPPRHLRQSDARSRWQSGVNLTQRTTGAALGRHRVPRRSGGVDCGAGPAGSPAGRGQASSTGVRRPPFATAARGSARRAPRSGPRRGALHRPPIATAARHPAHQAPRRHRAARRGHGINRGAAPSAGLAHAVARANHRAHWPRPWEEAQGKPSLAPPGSPLRARPRRSMAFPRSARPAPAEDVTPEVAAFGDQAPRTAAAWRRQPAGQRAIQRRRAYGGCHDRNPPHEAPVGRFAGDEISPCFFTTRPACRSALPRELRIPGMVISPFQRAAPQQCDRSSGGNGTSLRFGARRDGATKPALFESFVTRRVTQAHYFRS
jgi:hypothetical protein